MGCEHSPFEDCRAPIRLEGLTFLALSRGIPAISATFFQRHGRKITTVQILLAPLALYGALQAFNSVSTKTADWLPEAFSETQDLEWFEEHFSDGAILALSWEGCTVGDPYSRELADLLKQPIELPDGRKAPLVHEIVVAEQVLKRLRDEPLELPRTEALKRLRGWLVGPDGERAMILIFLNREGWAQREFLFGYLFEKVESITGLPREEIHLAGTAVDSVAIDQASQTYMPQMMLASYVLSFVFMYGVFRSLALTRIVFLDSYYCQMLSVALMYVAGTDMDSVMLIVPTLVYVLAVSTGVHLVSYYRDALQTVPPEQATQTALKHGLVPCVLSTVTTAVGLISLTVSVLVPVDRFATFSALGVMVSTATLLLVIPSKLERISRVANPVEQYARTGELHGLWDRLMAVVQRLQVPIVGVAAIALIASGWGVSRLKSSAHLNDQLWPDNKVIQDYAWFEKTIGPLVPIEIILRLPQPKSEASLSLADRMRYVAVTHALVAKEQDIGAVVSAKSFAPKLTQRRRGAKAAAEEQVLNKQLEKNVERYEEIGMLRQTEDEQLWRISARSYASRNVDYQSVLSGLRASTEQVLEKFHEQTGERASVIVCGGVPLVQKTQRQMLIDLREGFTVAVGIITGVFFVLAISGSVGEMRSLSNLREKGNLVSRRAAAACVAMVPNVLPCLAMFGAMGWAGVKMDIGSLLTASVALGIAVDDTLHFINWFFRAQANGASRVEAVRHAYVHCGPAMIRTTLICGLGLLVYAFSPFVPIVRFAWLMFAMLSAALIGDLVVLPALLLSKLGKLFEPVSGD